jgi:long-chain acyl-CoA synthetase
MSDWMQNMPPSHLEAHFGDRLVRCFESRPANLSAMLDDAVRRNPQGEALICGDERRDWHHVAARVERLAGGLAARGVSAGDRVALLLNNCIEFPEILLASARIGAIAVPLSHRSQQAELRYMLNHSGASLLVVSAELAGEIPTSDELSALKYRIAVGSSPNMERFTDLLEPALPPPTADVDENDTALLLYTSGTTGHPKGAMITHLGLVHAAMTYEYCMNLTASERTILAVPMSHVTAIAGNLCVALRCASTLIIMREFKAASFLQTAAKERMTHTVIVPAMYKLCLLQADFSQYELSAWRVGGYGGAPMPPTTIAEIQQKLPNLGLMNCYGATETVVPVAIMPSDETARYPDRVGRLVPCAEMAVMDGAGRQMNIGERGELWIKGPTVARGYWNDPKATVDAFCGGFWRSGDIGSITLEGHIGIHDRIKDMINRGGYKIFSNEVENVINAHPSVIESAVIGMRCNVLGERVHAFVTIKKPIETKELREFCAQQLSDYKIPETWTLQDGLLPRNANGKLLKRQLRDALAASASAKRTS